jgi:hypothetical protein
MLFLVVMDLLLR